jgi:hypothetical protein
VRWYFWVFGWGCGDGSRWSLGRSEGGGGGALGNSHGARVHGALIAPTHHTLASSASSQVNGYTLPVDAMRIDLRCYASLGGHRTSGALLGSFGGQLLADYWEVRYITRMCQEGEDFIELFNAAAEISA